MDLDTGMLAKVVKEKKVEEAVCIVIKMTGVITTVAGMVLTQTVEVNYATATLVLMLE